jgi:hypothetical protein
LHHAVQGAGFDLFLEFDAFQAWVAAGEPVAEADAGEVLVGEQDRDPPLGASSGDDDVGAGDVVDVGVGLQGRQRVAWLGAVADGLDGCWVEAGPPAVVEDLAGRSVGAIGQGAWLAGADGPPSLAEGDLDLRSLVFESGEPGSPDGLRDASAVGGRLGCHHAVQVAFLDVSHEPVVVAVAAGRIVWVKTVAEADAGEVAVGEQDGDPLPMGVSGGDHFGAGDVAGVVARLPWRQWVLGPGAVADGLVCHWVEGGLPAVADDPAGFSPGGHRQGT